MLYFAPWKIAFIALAVVIGAISATPNLFPQETRFNAEGEPQGIWRFVPNRGVNLGLDLRGGSYLLLEVDTDQVLNERLQGLQQDARTALRTAEIQATGFDIVDDAVTLRVNDMTRVDDAAEALRDLSEALPGTVGFSTARTRDVQVFDDRQIRVSITPEALEDIRRRTLSASIEVIRQRIDSLGTTEPLIQRQGTKRILVQVPGYDDPKRLKELIGRTARMSFHMVESDNPRDIQVALDGRISPLQELLPTQNPVEPYILVRKRASLAGDTLRNASRGVHPDSNQPIVNFTFNTTGGRVFCRLTSENVNRRFATVLDGVVITAPNINGPICGGSGYIEGRFTGDEAQDLATLLDGGALPADLTIVQESSVGATLGQESVDKGTMALVIGFIGVIVFMFAAYGLFGVFSNVALAANIVLIVGALSALQATLTLPGIAGIILTIGMAVDANVLIFERVREEIAAGRTPANAVEAGYKRAQSAILDANITTFLAAFLLYLLGSGPVRGFAVTLAIGIITSVFTAFVLSRYFVSLWFRAARPRALPL